MSIPVIYSNGLKARYGKVDMVVSAGDLTLGYYDFVISTLNKPLYFVFGNHHLEARAEFGKPVILLPGARKAGRAGARGDLPGGKGRAG